MKQPKFQVEEISKANFVTLNENELQVISGTEAASFSSISSDTDTGSFCSISNDKDVPAAQ